MFITGAFQKKSPVPQGTKSHFHRSKRRSIRSQNGFTLIEIIVTLILVGILAAVGGMGIVQAVKGYITVRENSATTQKAQLAMTRITREIIDMINIPSDATGSVLPINNISGNRIIGLDNGAVKIALDPATLADGDILIDNVSAFNLTYYSRNASTGAVITTTTWAAASDITTLTAIDINMQLTQPNSGVLTFTNRIAPRNNKNQSGATLPTATIPVIPTGWGINCFVATAAYGDSGHPMVQILRDFRDRYLINWQGGRWFVKQYYDQGPAAADLIRHRPLAMWVVRCLLAPVVALIFCLMYAPLAIPFILIVSLIITCALFTAIRSGFPLRSGVFRARGSILIALIITMVIMATLAAAMLSMFSASYMNQAYADQGRKTYFIAESGFRYAASYFLNAGTAGRNAAMTELNNKTCNLSGNAGSFTIIVYPYWFETQAATAGATTLVTQVYGTIPSMFSGSFSGGQILVKSSYYSYTSGSGSGSAITFSGLSPSLPATAAGLVVQPVTQPASNQSISPGGSGSLTMGTGYGIFPLLNGNFILKGETYNYRKRTGATLYNITKSNGTANANWTSSTSVSTTDKIILDKFIQLSSTGTIGNASREVLYNIPIGFLAGGEGWGKAQVADQLNSDANFFTAQAMGTHTTSAGAMRVTSVVDPSGSPTGLGAFLAGLLGWSGSGSGYWAFNAFNWANTNANLAQSWMDAGGSLSYDLQVKVKNTGPYFMAGLGFRMANNSNSTDLYQYGVSFVRARQTRTRSCLSPPDFICGGWGGYSQNNDMASNLIPAGLYPSSPETGSTYACGWPNGCQDQYSNPAIILWQRTGPTTTTGAFKLLAYHILTNSDGVLTGAAPNFRLKDWSSLMVRLIEGYELPFTLGLVDASSRHIKYGDTIKNSAGDKTARVIGTPIITTNWGGTNTTVAAGTLVLTNVTGGGFSNGENIYLSDGTSSAYAQASGAQATTKANYIMVYYSDDKTEVAGNTVEADNTRIGNLHDGANFVAGKVWPPDDRTDLAAGLPTADPAGNDYFSLVQWLYSVSGSGLFLSVTPVEGWTYSAPNLSRVVAHGTSITPSLTSGWTLGTGWSYGGSYLQKNSNGTGTAQPNPALAITNGVTYDVSITVTNLTAGSFSFTLGGASGGAAISGNGTYTRSITATGTGNLIFTPTPSNSRFRITAVSVAPRVTAANQPITHNTLNVGTTYDVAVNVSSLTSGSFYYTIGGCTSGTCSSTGACNLTCTASTTSPLTFISPAIGNSFTIGSISVTSADTYMGTLDTTADGQGNVASFVQALNTSDFYDAVIKTGALKSTVWTSSSTTVNFSGDAIALSTSGCTPSTSGCYGAGSYTYYDDFGIQLDLKGGGGFLPPIQQ